MVGLLLEISWRGTIGQMEIEPEVRHAVHILLVDFEPGLHVRSRQHKYTFNGKCFHTKEVWFFCRVFPFEIDKSALFGTEKVAFLGYRWWTHSELATTRKILAPRRLVPLLRDLISNGVPQNPVDLGVE